MSLPNTIRTSVSQAAITKVTRLFNGSAKDVLTELLQNARRAGATAVSIATYEVEGRAVLAVSDDGRGIDDPAKLVSLAASGWDAGTARREDPAGMGRDLLEVDLADRPPEPTAAWYLASVNEDLGWILEAV